jgi:hypothetical protein
MKSKVQVRAGGALLTLILVATSSRAVADELTCVFQMTTASVPRGAPGAEHAPGIGQGAAPAAPKRTTETRRTIVGLSKDAITVTDGAASMIAYHFPSKRMYVLDLREKTYADVSLYGTVAFRINELIQRRAMREGLAAAGVKLDDAQRDATDQFTVESLVSRRLPDDAARADAPTATVGQHGKTLQFHRGDRRFVVFKPSAQAMPPEYTKSWTRFLVIQCSIHPTIRQQIVRTGAVPELLEFSYFDSFGSATVTYRLESAGAKPDRWSGVPEGFKPKLVPGDRLGHVLARIDPRAPNNTLRDAKAAEHFIDDNLARGHALDAYLGWIEYSNLADDDAPTQDKIQALLAKILAAKDDRVSALRFKQETPNESETIVKAIDRTDRRGLAKGYQLDAWRGLLLVNLGRVDEANNSLLKALEANPFLLNCYRQLGDNYFQAFQTVDAWRCFDAIRQIDAKSHLLKSVIELEARYEKDFPDDF